MNPRNLSMVCIITTPAPSEFLYLLCIIIIPMKKHIILARAVYNISYVTVKVLSWCTSCTCAHLFSKPSQRVDQLIAWKMLYIWPGPSLPTKIKCPHAKCHILTHGIGMLCVPACSHCHGNKQQCPLQPHLVSNFFPASEKTNKTKKQKTRIQHKNVSPMECFDLRVLEGRTNKRDVSICTSD